MLKNLIQKLNRMLNAPAHSWYNSNHLVQSGAGSQFTFNR
jgi:hypothetical protein